jgi:hypothetical protein
MRRVQHAASYLRQRRGAAPVATALLIAGTIAGAVGGTGRPADAAAVQAAAAPACPGWTVARPPDPGAQDNLLQSVAVLSASNIWAVGSYTSSTTNAPFHTLIEHWNGKAWAQVPSPNPGSSSDFLTSIAAVSATNIWAVGEYDTRPDFIEGNKTLILHWNGHTWTRVATPNLDAKDLINDLGSVTVLSPSSAWLVGTAHNFFSAFEGTAIEMHWNGHAWSMMTTPSTNSGNSALFGVQATASVSPWAVGESGLSNQVQRTLVFRCR